MEKKYCAAPWRSLHINFLGQVKTCCAGVPTGIGAVGSATINDLIQSPMLNEVKQSIANGVLHEKYCHNCIEAERFGSSERSWHNNLNEDFDFANALQQTYKPTLIDVRWATTCNLACNYCGPYCSSKWADLMSYQPPDDSIRKHYDEVLGFIEQNTSHVKEVALVGGEPLLLKENNKLLDFLPDDILVTVITNLSVDFSSNKIAQKLLHRSRTGWSISFENVGERFEYVRYGADWTVMDSNVSTVADLIQNTDHHGGIHAVYNLYNCTRLCELKQYAVDKGVSIMWQTLHHPDVLDPLKHCSEIRTLALREIYRYQDSFDLDDQELNFSNNVKQMLEQSLAQPDNLLQQSQFNHEFLSWTDTIENQWHPKSQGKFNLLWPELAQAL